MKLTPSAEYQKFRSEVAKLLESNRYNAPTPEDRGLKHPKRLAWQKWLIENGLTARTIPKAYGGFGAAPDGRPAWDQRPG